MRHIHLRLIPLLLCLYVDAMGQNYFTYQQIWNRVDIDLEQQNLTSSLHRMDSVFNAYDFIYAQHCFKALQICGVQCDSVRAEKWLKTAFLHGVQPWMIRTNDCTKNLFLFNNCQKILADFNSYHALYLHTINHGVRKQIDSLIEIDQAYTKRVNDGFFLFRNTLYGWQWLRNNKRQFAKINTIMRQIAFPGERLIGLPTSIEDSVLNYKNFVFYGPNLAQTHAYIMLIHYFSNPRPDINEALLENVKRGYLPAYQFGALNDFMARWGKKRYGDFQYYNVWHTDTTSANRQTINARRIAIGLNRFEEQERHQQLRKENRKNKTANQMIVLE